MNTMTNEAKYSLADRIAVVLTNKYPTQDWTEDNPTWACIFQINRQGKPFIASFDHEDDGYHVASLVKRRLQGIGAFDTDIDF